MKIVQKIVLLLCVAGTLCFAKSGKELAEELKIEAGSKAIVQWERMFENKKRLGKIGAENLSDADLQALKEYLIKHAADSDQPAAAGL